MENETREEIDALAARLTREHEAGRAWRKLPSAPAPFVPDMGECPQHGAYALNLREADGTVRWRSPVCPGCERMRAVGALLNRAVIAPRFARCGFDNFIVTLPEQQTALSICRNYADEFETMHARGTCLILRGQPGTGKNHLAVAISHSVLARGMSVLNATAHELIMRIRDTWHRGRGEARASEPGEGGVLAGAALSEAQVLQRIARIDLLIIDEVGRQYAGRDGAESLELFNVIDARYRICRPTIVISNGEPAIIRAYLGPAAYDRLRENGGKLAHFDWESYRGNGVAQEPGGGDEAAL